jgi:hypothetical protein
MEAICSPETVIDFRRTRSVLFQKIEEFNNLFCLHITHKLLPWFSTKQYFSARSLRKSLFSSSNFRFFFYFCQPWILFRKWTILQNVKGKAIPVAGRGGPWVCETSRLTHSLENRLTDGGEVISLKRRSQFSPRKIPGAYFFSRLSRPQGRSAAGRIISIELSSDLIENRTLDFLVCSIVPQPTGLPRVPLTEYTHL